MDHYWVGGIGHRGHWSDIDHIIYMVSKAEKEEVMNCEWHTDLTLEVWAQTLQRGCTFVLHVEPTFICVHCS